MTWTRVPGYEATAYQDAISSAAPTSSSVLCIEEEQTTIPAMVSKSAYIGESSFSLHPPVQTTMLDFEKKIKVHYLNFCDYSDWVV